MLAPISHTQLLETILAELKGKHVFHATGSRLSISTDGVATETAKKLAATFASPIVGNASAMRTASLNMNDKAEKEFSRLLGQIFAELRQQFEHSLVPLHTSPHDYLTNALPSLQQIKDRATS